MRKRILSIILLAALSVSLMGCATKADTKNAVVGTWKTTVDFNEYFENTIDNSTVEDMLDLSDAKFTLSAEINEDNTCKISVNEDEIANWLDRVKSYTLTAVKSTYEETLEAELEVQETSTEELYDYLEVEDFAGYFEKSQGQSLEAYVDEQFSPTFSNIESSLENMNIDGTYEEHVGYITITYGDKNQTAVYDEVNDTLTLAGDSEKMESVTFTRK